MKNIILILVLAYLALSDDVVISGGLQDSFPDSFPSDDNLVLAQSDTSDIQSSVVSRSELKFPDNFRRLPSNKAKYIQASNPPQNQYKAPNPNVPNVPAGFRVLVINRQFYTTCVNPMTLYIYCNAQFYILVNGQIVGSGNGFAIINIISPPLRCGSNTLTIIMFYNAPIRLWYFLYQNTSGCYKCPPGQRWNPYQCSCECKKHCCTDKQTFRGLPYCDCICQCQRQLSCDKRHYWDENSCTCQCLPPIPSCPKGTRWNEFTCSCVFSPFIDQNAN